MRLFIGTLYHDDVTKPYIVIKSTIYLGTNFSDYKWLTLENAGSGSTPGGVHGRQHAPPVLIRAVNLHRVRTVPGVTSSNRNQLSVHGAHRSLGAT